VLRRAAARRGEDAVTTRKPVNRAVFEGSDMVALRLRAARKPLVIDLLEIPPEEIDFEPVLIDPMDEDPEPRPGAAVAAPMRGGVQPLFGVGWVEVKPDPRGA
jgi:hypothetical protein